MVSGVGFTELLLLFVIGLLILGPERLPRVASQLGRWVGKARRTANQLRFQMEREIALADIERSKKKSQNDRPKASSSGTAGTAGQSGGTGGTEAGTTGSTADAAAAGAPGQAVDAPEREPATTRSDSDGS